VIENCGGYGLFGRLSDGNRLKNNVYNNVQKSAVYYDQSKNLFVEQESAKDTCLINPSLGATYSVFRFAKMDNVHVEKAIIKGSEHSNALYSSESTNIIVKDEIFDSGFSGLIGGDASSYADTHIGARTKQLFDGDLALVNDVAILSEDIRGFNTLVVLGNDNSGTNASLTSVTIPKPAYYVGAATSRFRLVPDSNTGDRVGFSFTDYKTVRLDEVVGSCHIRKIIGVR
jgi:hypothetical protein